ncbi:LD-carboxypeptidase [Robbsia andropogonis]|uniref:LD-carboxypeptidase n=1 Tax=Robbsia andropogonis TaxID=28092 RepID=UPI000465777D|nr:LD-carboxypeptidase [Robbsia andropogonis]MCP1117551.1 LD-carboxypeptidase [Robbsia andropogonis]MCP1127017.1 LD-carboxypeptidase [Robbsia andropogonis]
MRTLLDQMTSQMMSTAGQTDGDAFDDALSCDGGDSLRDVPQRPCDIRLVAPSGYADLARVARAVAYLRARGHHLAAAGAASRKFERFAGTDTERLSDWLDLANPAVAVPDIVMAVRGGYGVVRVLDGIDYGALRERFTAPGARCPIITGYSDITALHLALYQKAGMVTFAGPMLASNFGADIVSRFTETHFWSLIQSSRYTIDGTLPDQPHVDVEGILWGGNLATLGAFAGTPYMPPIEGGILFLEDVHEQPYRIERVLYQLHLCGILKRQRAIVLGHFTGADGAQDYNNGYTLATTMAQIGAVSGVPIVWGLPFGHVDDIVTLPFGATARLQSGSHGFTLTVSDYPTLSTS